MINRTYLSLLYYTVYVKNLKDKKDDLIKIDKKLIMEQIFSKSIKVLKKSSTLKKYLPISI